MTKTKTKKTTQERLLSLSRFHSEEILVGEPDKLSPVGLHHGRYTLRKVISSSRKAKKKRLSRGRGGVKKTQILEDKVGLTREEVMEEISKNPVASSMEIKELTPKEFKEYTRRLLGYYKAGEVDYFVCDLETQQTEWYHPDGKIIGYAVADPKERVGYFVGLQHPELKRTEAEQQLITKCIEKLHRTIPLVNHNVMFDIHWLVEKTSLEPRDLTVKADTMYQCSLVVGRDRLHPGEKMSLKDMAKRILGMDFSWGDLIGNSLKDIRLKINRVFFNLKYEMISVYACFDSIVTLKLYEEINKRIEEDGIQKVNELMTGSVVPFVEIEHQGIAVEDNLRKQLLIDYKEKMKRIKKSFSMLPMVQKFNEGHKRNCLISSHDDLRELFFTPKYYCINPMAETDSGLASTSADVMKEISGTTKNEFREPRKAAELVLRYRAVHKLESTYLSPVKDQMKDKMFIPDYNLIGARTGRISSYFHTIPSGNDIKRIFISRWADQGGLIFSGDYSQLEVRVIAGLAKDKKLQKSYQEGYDIHRYVASQIFNKPMEKVSSGERGYAKTVVFGILFGKTVWTLSKDLGVSKEEAQELLDFFFVGFPGVKKWVDEQHSFVKQNGYIVMPWGRRRYIPWIRSSDDWKYEKALRMSQNSPVQGTASDICLSATNRMQDETVQRNLKSNIIGTVHDSIESDTHPSELFDMVDIMRYHAEEYANTHEDFDFMNGVPLRFDFEIGTSWGGAVEVEEFITDKKWKLSGFELDINDLIDRLEMNHNIHTSSFVKDKADLDKVFRTIDPGEKYEFELEFKS